jgi:putative glutathione S-transferase
LGKATEAFNSVLPDRANGFTYLHQLCTAARPDYTGRVLVPVLWDTRTSTIVSNESAEIVRMLNQAFNAFGNGRIDLYPAPLRIEIDRIIEPSPHQSVTHRAGRATA